MLGLERLNTLLTELASSASEQAACRLVVVALEEVYGRGAVALDPSGILMPASPSRLIEVTEAMVMEAIHTHPASLVMNELLVVEGKPGRLGPEDANLVDLVSDYLRLTLCRLDKSVQEGDDDPLTGLHGAHAFEDDLPRMLEVHSSVSLLLLDLDDFSKFNQEFGVIQGDQRLREVADALRSILRPDDKAYRLHSDEFALLCPLTSAQQASTIAENLRRDFELRFLTRLTTASIGVAEWPDHAGGKHHLLQAAKRALHAAWEDGGNRVLVSVPRSPQ